MKIPCPSSLSVPPSRPVSAALREARASGVALVATLIMLSLVTFMVVAFLGVARRERRSVAASLAVNEARAAMEAAQARGQADLAALLITFGDKYAYGVMVPTNYQNTGWYNTVSPTNVNDILSLLQPGQPLPWLTNLGNLRYDARVPVFSSYYTNRTPYAPLFSETNLGRYYYDFNRDGMFESTDRWQTGDPHWLGILDYPGVSHGPTNQFIGRYTYLIAPAGKAMDLNLIHNAAKRRGGAPVFFPPALAPMTNSPYTTYEGYYRNLGLAPYEFNLAALLTQLAPSHYLYNYDLNPVNPSQSVPVSRDAFRDAFDLFMFRANTNYNALGSNSIQFGATSWRNLTNSMFDLLGNGPLMGSSNLVFSSDFANFSWPGGNNAHAAATRFFDLNEVFLSARRYSGTFATNLNYLSTNNQTATLAGDFARRTYYNLLSTLGVESWPQTDKLNLNWLGTRFLYWNNPAPGTFQLAWSNSPSTSVGGDYHGFQNWPSDPFFNTAAELMLRASHSPTILLNTNWAGFGGGETNMLVTNYYFGTTFVGTNSGVLLSVTNIPIFGIYGNYYLPEVHRLLQFAANIYDAAGPPEWVTGVPYAAGDRVQRGGINYVARNANTSVVPPNAATWDVINGAFLPTVFRPVFAFNTNGWPSNDFIQIAGYTTNRTDVSMVSLPVVDLNDPNSRMAMYQTDGNVAGGSNACLVGGLPVIVGARKGYPSFNEFGVQSLFSVTRRLEFVKTNTTNAGPLNLSRGRPLAFTNQSLIIGLTNIIGFEAWNSYTGAFPRPLQLVVTNVAYTVLTNEFGPLYTNITVNTTNIGLGANAWQGTANGRAAFRSFLFTNVLQLSTNFASGYSYATNYPPLPGFTNGGFAPASPVAAGLAVFNRSNGFPEMRLGITISNSLRYALIDANRVVDFVNLTNLVAGMDLATALRVTNNPADLGVRFWFTNRLGAVPFGATLGISNQIAMCLDTNLNNAASNQWRQYSLNTPILREIDRFRKWMGTNGPLPYNQSLNTNVTSIQSPFNPTRVVAFSASWEANDPLVHHTTHDLTDPFRTSTGDQVTPVPLGQPIPLPGTVYSSNNVLIAGQFRQFITGGTNRYYLPWGRMLDPVGTRLANLPNFYVVAPPAYDQRLKDAGVFRSQEWDFPQRRFANLGWLGRVHRGTPWQTFYLKSDIPNRTNWYYWAHSVDTNPTNDWRLAEVFTAAIDADATRGLLSVNQTNAPAWAAALGGTLVLTNSGPSVFATVIEPSIAGRPQLATIVGTATNGVINARQRIPMWQPTANYSANDIVAYEVGPYTILGDPVPHSARYYRSLNGTNFNLNPFLMLSTNNFTYWTNVFIWSSAVTYAAGDVVAHFDVSYFSLIGGNANLPPHLNPGAWEAWPKRSFSKHGYVLATPELSVRSPYLNVGRPWINRAYAQGERVSWQGWYYQALRNVPAGQPPNPYVNYADTYMTAQSYWWPLESPLIARNGGTVDALNEVFVERIPQQTLGLMHLEPSPRVVIYAIGQSVRPAERGVYVGGGPYQLMVTNYQISGEQASRAVVRIDNLPENGALPRPLPPQPWPAGTVSPIQPRFIVESFKLLPADFF